MDHRPDAVQMRNPAQAIPSRHDISRHQNGRGAGSRSSRLVTPEPGIWSKSY